MTLREALDVALAAYDEDEGEREAILAALVPVVLGNRELLRAAIVRAWGDTGSRGADEICDAVNVYQAERAEIDAEIAAT